MIAGIVAQLGAWVTILLQQRGHIKRADTNSIDMRAEVQHMRDEVGELRGEVRDDIGSLRGEMRGVRDDLGQLRGDLRDEREARAELAGDHEQLGRRVDQLSRVDRRGW